MTDDRSPLRRDVEILNALGLHLRPAEKFVGLAGRFASEIRIRYQGRECNGKSMLDLMTLAALQGTRLEITATGPDAEQALDALARLVADRFHEDDNGEELPASPPASQAPPPAS